MVVYILFHLACDYAHRGEVTAPNYEGLEQMLQSIMSLRGVRLRRTIKQSKDGVEKDREIASLRSQ